MNSVCFFGRQVTQIAWVQGQSATHGFKDQLTFEALDDQLLVNPMWLEHMPNGEDQARNLEIPLVDQGERMAVGPIASQWSSSDDFAGGGMRLCHGADLPRQGFSPCDW